MPACAVLLQTRYGPLLFASMKWCNTVKSRGLFESDEDWCRRVNLMQEFVPVKYSRNSGLHTSFEWYFQNCNHLSVFRSPLFLCIFCTFLFSLSFLFFLLLFLVSCHLSFIPRLSVVLLLICKLLFACSAQFSVGFLYIFTSAWVPPRTFSDISGE